MKAHGIDPIEKQALILRLSVNVYKMTDDQIRHLLSILDQDADTGSSGANPPSARQDSVIQRQMMIARLFVLIQHMDPQVLLAHLNTFNHRDFCWAREFPRVGCNVLVDFAIHGKAYRGYLRDISAGGIFIVTPERFQIGQEISMCFSFSTFNEDLSFKIIGKVQRKHIDGIGVMYHEISHHQQNAIHSLIEKKAALG